MPTFIIIGDSQAQANKQQATTRLLSDGYSFLGIFAQHGAGSNKVFELAKQAKSAAPNPDLILVFSGSVENSIISGREIPKLFLNSQIIWYGSSPATKILNLPLAKKVFGSKVDSEDYWFETDESKNRESRNNQQKAYFKNTNVQYVDYRDLKYKNEELQKSGVMFPDLQDGIHITPTVSKDIFSSENFPPKTEIKKGFSVTTVLVSLAVTALTVVLLYKLKK